MQTFCCFSLCNYQVYRSNCTDIHLCCKITYMYFIRVHFALSFSTYHLIVSDIQVLLVALYWITIQPPCEMWLALFFHNIFHEATVIIVATVPLIFLIWGKCTCKSVCQYFLSTILTYENKTDLGTNNWEKIKYFALCRHLVVWNSWLNSCLWKLIR